MKSLTLIHVGAGGETTTDEVDPAVLLRAKSALACIQRNYSIMEDADEIAGDILRIFGVQCEVITPYPDWPDAQAIQLVENGND